MAVARYEIVIRPIGDIYEHKPKLQEAMTTCEWCPYNTVVKEGRLERVQGFLTYMPKQYGCAADGGRTTEGHIPDWCPMGLTPTKEGESNG